MSNDTLKEEFIEITFGGQTGVVIAASTLTAKNFAVGEQVKVLKEKFKADVKALKATVLARPLSGGEILRGGHTLENTVDIRNIQTETAPEA